MDDEHAQMQSEQTQLHKESERIKLHNKTLFQSVASHQDSVATSQQSTNLLQGASEDQAELADIHGLY